MRTDWNFRARSLRIFVIWPNYGTCAILCDSVTTSFLARSCLLANSLAHRGEQRLQFLRATTSNIRHFVQLGYLCDFARSQEGQSFSARDRFSLSSFGVIWEPLRSRVIPRWSIFRRVRNFPDPPGSAPVGIFARNHFLSSSFGLIMVPVRFHDYKFSRARACVS